MVQIKRRERDAVLQSLQAGLVPRMGLHLIQVGRKAEVQAMLSDLDRIADGGAAFRIVVGRFGTGKSFFMNLVRTLALQKGFVVVQADLSMERRIYASDGKARSLYAELVRNLAIKSRPDGGALRNLCEGWVSDIHHRVLGDGGSEQDVEAQIMKRLSVLKDHVGGFEFAQALAAYYQGYATGESKLQDAALRWLRAEYTTKTEARQDLGVRRIIDDESLYDSLKLLAAFCKLAGYSGLLVNLDEMVVLSHRLPSSRARSANYEALLTILNDCFQGSCESIGFLLAGTDEFLEDKRRGLYSYEALRSRLAENPLAQQGVVDYSGPCIRLNCLTPEDLFVLLHNIRHVHASGDAARYAVPDEAIAAVLSAANQALGAEFYKTPRDIVRSFVYLLNVLDQNPGKSWREFLDGNLIQTGDGPASIEEEVAAVGASADDEDDLETFRL